MTRQYIGARYVPKFDGEWNENKVYEPLTIVEYNNGSYTSKIPVPAGTLPTNKEYWALTGSTNGFIQKLQGDVEDLKGYIRNNTPVIVYVKANFKEANFLPI